MTPQHTQGEWLVDKQHPKGAIGIRTEGGLIIAVARYSDNRIITKEQAEANARLIASAPKTAAERDSLRTELNDLVTRCVKADQRTHELKTLNTKLLDALKSFIEGANNSATYTPETYDKAQAAIRAAKGGAA